jgi:ferredoxin/flavodoxin---NADP+ reductase
MEKKLYDITIVGAGPVGLFGVFYAGMRQLSVNIVDSLEAVGGQLSALYPEKYIYDMPGFPKVMAKDLVRALWDQASFAKPDLHLGRKVIRIEKRGDLDFLLHCENGETFSSRTVVLALGMGAFRPRKLESSGLAEREGKTVHYLVKPLDFYRGKNVLIVGGGDSAADWTMALALGEEGAPPRAKSVTLIHRTEKFSAHEATLDIIRKQTKAEICTHMEIEKVEDAPHGGLQVSLVQNLKKETQERSFDEIIVCAGYIAKLDFVKESGLLMQGSSVVVNEKMETNIPGIFAVGDLAHHGAKLKLIATGVGEAAIAANFAKTLIDPKAKAFPGHSTSKFEEKSH